MPLLFTKETLKVAKATFLILSMQLVTFFVKDLIVNILDFVMHL